MAVDKLVDSTKLNNSLEYTADRIRLKAGISSDITFDFANETGFGAAIDAIPSGGGSGGIVISDAADPAGGTVRTITAVEISGTKSITQNGTGIDVTSYESVDVNVPTPAPTLQAKTNISPTTSSQTIQADSGYDGLSSVQINAMPTGTAGTPTATKGTVSNHSVTVTPSVTNTTGYITGSTKTGTGVTVSASELVSGSETKTANGTYDVTNLASLVVNVPVGKSGQLQSKTARTSSTTYTDMGFEITVAKAGTYDIYWTGYRSSTGGTNGAQVYVNDSAEGNVQTTFDGTYTNCQNGHLSNVSLAKDDKVTIRARARSSSYYMYIMNLAIIEA